MKHCIKILKILKRSIRTSAHLHVCTFILTLFIFSNAHALAPVDSVGVKYIKGSKFIKYKVAYGEGWYGIARKYKTTVNELRNANKDTKAKMLSPGQFILIPIIKPQPSVDKASGKITDKPILHKVKKGETLFTIAEKSGQTMKDIRQWNKLKNNNLQEGQELVIGYEIKKKDVKKENKKELPGSPEPMGAPGQVKQAEVKKTIDTSSVKNHKPDSIKHVLKDSLHKDTTKNQDEGWKAPAPKGTEVEERGMASFIEDEDINPHKYYALHRLAPRGTIIKVTNIMTGKQIYVKVVGVLPGTGDNSDLIIKISKASAAKLGVLDARFQVVLNYYGE